MSEKLRCCRFGMKVALLVGALVAVGVGVFGWEKWNRMQQYYDIDSILENSVLKNRQFSSSVREIKSGDLSAYLMEEHSNPIVSISFMFSGSGRAHEPDGKQGLVSVLTDVLKKGAGDYDSETIIDLCSEYGVNIDFSAGLDEIAGEVQFPKQNAEIAIKLLNAVLTKPHFEANYLNLSKKQYAIAVHMKKEKVRAFATDQFREVYFAGHPYARPSVGIEDEIMSVTAEDLRQFIAKKLALDNLQVAIAGDVTEKEATEMLQKVFASLPQHSDVQNLPQVDIQTSGRHYYREFQAAQTYVLFAVPGVYRNDADFYPLYLVNYIFGASGLESRLNKSLREEDGLTYGVYTYLNLNEAATLVEGAFSSTVDNLPRALELLVEEWNGMAEGNITADELQKAKDAIIASANLRYAAIGGISNMLLRMQEYHLGLDFLEKRNDYIRNVSLQQVNDAARKYFSVLPDFVIAGIQNKEVK